MDLLFDKDNIIYDTEHDIFCLYCNVILNNNICYDNENIKIICKQCNKELQHYQLISCSLCNYNFLILHNYIKHKKIIYIKEYFKIYEKLTHKIPNNCTHISLNTFLKMPFEY